MTELIAKDCCDVFVAGAGIAGIMAALEAAARGRRVMLASAAKIFSGSSFYPGTWGLGVVTPEDEADEEDLIQTILRVGCGMADEAMVRGFVADMIPLRAYLQELGLELRQAENRQQAEFIPCFDHKLRNWQGLVGETAKKRFAQLLRERNVVCLEQCELVEIVEDQAAGEKHDTCVAGVIVCRNGQELAYIRASAVILATGGYGGLFEHRLTTGDVTGMGQYLALKHGCSLVNMEFMQMMPALPELAAPGAPPVIFHEKTFRFIESDKIPAEIARHLPLRAAYGPFTSRLESKAVDFAIAAQGEKGLRFTYSRRMFTDTPEFIRAYVEWLAKRRAWQDGEMLRMQMYAHAANGGIRIAGDGSTPLKGLYACGESTGGMHGADRIGGLSTVNGFVFGRRAGAAAADYAGRACGADVLGRKELNPVRHELWELEDPHEQACLLQQEMSRHAMVIRTEAGLEQARTSIAGRRRQLQRIPATNVARAVLSGRVWGQMVLAEGILLAEQLRKESRGSHYRKDYPGQSTDNDKRIIVCLQEGGVQAQFE